MQYSELKKVLKGRLARFSASTSLDGYINTELNACMEELEEEAFLPWFLCKRVLDINIPPNTSTHTLPADFLRERLEETEKPYPEYIQIINTDLMWQPVKRAEGPLPLIGVNPALGQPAEGFPEWYSIDQVYNVIQFDKVQPFVQVVAFEYYGKGDRYTADPQDTEEPAWAKHAPGYIIALTGMRIANMYIKNKEAGQLFLADANRERVKLIQKHSSIMEGAMSPNTEN